MKKLIVLSLCLLFFVGCSNASAKVSNGSESIVSVGGKKVTKQQVYEILRDQDSGETVLNIIINAITSKEVTLTSEIEAEAKVELAAAKKEMAEDYDYFLEYYGYDSDEVYYEKEILPATLYNYLPDSYIEENWDKVMEYYYPTTARIIETASADAANAAKAEIQDGKSFATVAKKYTTKSKDLYDGSEQVYSRNDSDTLPTFVNEFIRTATGPTLSGVISNDAADKFYIVQITGKNPEQYTEKAIAAVKESEDLENDMMAYYCKKYNLRIYDVDLYEIFKEYYPTYLQK